MNLPRFSIKHPVTMLMFILIIVLFGTIAFFHLGLDLMPELDFPVAMVITSYRGVAAEDIEKSITKPIEDVVSVIEKVKRVYSVTREGSSIVVVEFEWGANLDFAAQDVRDKLGWAEMFLPEDAEKPMVMKFSMSDMPVIFFAVTGLENSMVLRDYLEDVVSPRLDSLEGVGATMIMGGLIREIQITIDKDKLESYGLSIDQVIQTLRRENLNVSGGHITAAHSEFLLRTMGEYKKLDAIRDTVITVHQKRPICIKDVAEIKDTHREIRDYTRVDGKDSVMLAVAKQSGANTVQVANRIMKTLDEMAPQMPADIKFAPIWDTADMIKQVTSRTTENAISGAILAILFILLFLRNWRPTLTISLAIPLSIIATFMGLYLFDYTLNVLTIAGMALAAGLLVDNAVVVIENTFRHLEEGKNRKIAAQVGTTEVGLAITASTLTTMCVFIPIILVKGIAGQLFRSLALTVCLALLASLFVAVTLVPMFISRIFRSREKIPTQTAGEGIPQKVISPGFQGSKDFYRRLLQWVLTHKTVVIGITLLLFILSLLTIPLLGMEFMPQRDIPMTIMQAKLPPGTPLDKTDQVVRRIENYQMTIPENLYVMALVGPYEMSATDVSMGWGAVDVNEAMIMSKLVPKLERPRSSEEIKDDIRQHWPQIEGATLKFLDFGGAMMTTGPDPTPIAIRVFGKDLNQLSKIGQEIIARIKDVKGLRDLDTTLKQGKPELRIRIDRAKAARFGLSVAQVANQFHAAVKGQSASKFRLGGEEWDILVRFKEQDRNTINKIKDIKIASPIGVQVPLNEVVKLEPSLGPLMITRENRLRKVTVLGSNFKRDIGSVTKDIKERLSDLELPAGYFIDHGGQYKDMQETFSTLVWALLIAIVLVYMVMAALFESLIQPFIVMFTVPLGLIGVIFGLLVCGQTLSTIAFLGFIILTGIVVNNAIVLINYINQLRQRGLAIYDAIIEGAVTRLRPILITSITTILGILPIGLSRAEGSEMRNPLGIAIAFGLFIGMFLTLFVIPCVYMIATRITRPEEL